MSDEKPPIHPLRAWRDDVGLSARQCAARIGVTPKTWHSWERWASVPSPSILPALLALTGGAVTADALYTYRVAA